MEKKKKKKKSYPCDVAAGGTNAVDVETNAACTLGNKRALLERVIDTLYAIGAHRQQEATENETHLSYS
jgi:hypothetical protein